MWKRLGKKFGRHHGAHATHHGDDFSTRLYLDRHCTHGFPLSPSCMTYDAHRGVLIIGTSSGEIRMLGQPGVELTGLHDDINKVLQILPFASEPSLITVCANNILHKWSLITDDEGASRLVCTRTYKFQGGLAKKITTCCLPLHCDCLFVGTLGGITYPIDTEFDGMSPEVLSWSRARAYLNYHGKDVPGEVCTLEINPTNPKQLLIGYLHNYLELWDALSWKPIAYYGAYKDDGIEDILSSAWSSGGSQFVTTHNDGSIAFWSVDNYSRPMKIKKSFGGEPVQDMLTILWPEDDLLVVSGGSPLSLVDAHSVTLMEKDKNYTLQLTSPVRGMYILDGIQADRDSGIVNYGDNSEGEGLVSKQRVLILLLEQEILFIDLTLPELPLLRPPYLYSVHNSPPKCSEVYEKVSRDTWQIISQAGRVQQEMIFKARSRIWPIDGGILQQTDSNSRDMLVTGHEDGTLKFWDISTVSMKLLYVLKSAVFFTSFDSDFFDNETPENERDDVKHICFWDPRSDDDQLQVSCLEFHEDNLLVGFKGGLLLLFHLNNQSATVTIPLHRVSILRDDPRQRGRNWQAPMELRLDGIECAPGYQPTFCVGIFPNMPITAIGFAKQQKLVGVGCMYGFTVVDYLKSTTVHVSSTFIADTNVDQGHLSRMQSIRKSFRQSLKRLNVRRSMRGGQSTQRSFRPALVRSGSTRPSMKNRPALAAGIGASPGGSAEPTPMPPRRDSIRTITFCAPCQLARHAVSSCLLVGTNQGGILAYSIDMPSEKQRESKSPIVMPIERDFNPRRNYAVLFSGVIDHQNYLLDINDPGSYHHNSSKGGQWIVVVTEDCIKLMSLPSLKKKLRVRLKQSDNDELHIQSCHHLRTEGQSFLVLMCSDGFVSMYSIPELKLVCKEDCVDASDAFGQRNFSMTSRGLFVHMRSPSEFTRGSLAEQARVNLHFTIPTKSITKVTPTSKSLSKDPICEVSIENLETNHESLEQENQDVGHQDVGHQEIDITVEMSPDIEDISSGALAEDKDISTTAHAEDNKEEKDIVPVEAKFPFEERAL